MHTRCRGRCAAAAAILVAARATPVITVDDSDPGIEYRGVWTRNPSTDAAATPPPHTSGASQSQTSILASGAATPGSTAARTDSSKLPAGAIAGLAIAGLVVLIFVGSVGHSRCGRRKQAQRQRRNDPTPYDPGLTALAFEHSEKRDRELHDGNRTDSAAASLLPLPLPAGVRAWGTSGERNLAHDIGTSDLEGTARMNDDRRTRFESSASPLSPRHSRGIRLQKASQITPNAGKSRYLSPPDDRRRSMDGGVRLAGGPMESERQEGDRGDDARSGVSTLPPAYGLYLAA